MDILFSVGAYYFYRLLKKLFWKENTKAAV